MFKRVLPCLFVALTTSWAYPISTPKPPPTSIIQLTTTKNENTPFPSPTISPTPMSPPSRTPTESISPSPTFAPTPAPITPQTNSPTQPPAITSIPLPAPNLPLSPTLSPSGICDALAAAGRGGLVIVYLNPYPELKWDMQPRVFHVGICNTLPVPLVPESDFVLSIRLPYRRLTLGQTPHLPAQLSPGFHEIILSPWTPGLENHVTICVQRSTVDLELGYSDQSGSRNYRPVQWLDSSTSHSFTVKCGGDYS